MSQGTFKIKLDDLRFAHTSRTPGCPGTEMFVATHFATPLPVCTIWYRSVNMHVLEVLDIFTPVIFRRQGVALKTLLTLPSYYDGLTVSTATTNDESRGLIIKAGFRQERDGWFLRPKHEEVCPQI